MFSWYSGATMCIAYLADVDTTLGEIAVASAFKRSEWFRRGWTLQELLAPTLVIFCDVDWKILGHSYWTPSLRTVASSGHWGPHLGKAVEQITGIQLKHMHLPERLSSVSVATRMSWAAKRKTTRIEDEAYCLLGLFEINMPLLYGEGRMAFQRLQEEIVRRSTDQSVFAWAHRQRQIDTIFAPSPEYFAESSHIVKRGPSPKPYAVTNFGVQMQVQLRKLIYLDPDHAPCEIYLLRLDCGRAYRLADNKTSHHPVMIALVRKIFGSGNRYSRAFSDDLGERFDNLETEELPEQVIYLCA